MDRLHWPVTDEVSEEALTRPGTAARTEDLVGTSPDSQDALLTTDQLGGVELPGTSSRSSPSQFPGCHGVGDWRAAASLNPRLRPKHPKGQENTGGRTVLLITPRVDYGQVAKYCDHAALTAARQPQPVLRTTSRPIRGLRITLPPS